MEQTSFMVVVELYQRKYRYKMSWKKESARVGLAGLIPREAVKGALLCPDFQNIPEPFGNLIREVEVSTVFRSY